MSPEMPNAEQVSSMLIDPIMILAVGVVVWLLASSVNEWRLLRRRERRKRRRSLTDKLIYYRPVERIGGGQGQN